MEEWRDIEGYEGLYQVSNFGRVKSLANNKTRKEKILKPETINGYLRVCLFKKKEKKTYTCSPFGCIRIYPKYG